MLTERHESKSIRVNSVNDDGSEVLSSGATFGDTNITISLTCWTGRTAPIIPMKCRTQ